MVIVVVVVAQEQNLEHHLRAHAQCAAQTEYIRLQITEASISRNPSEYKKNSVK